MSKQTTCQNDPLTRSITKFKRETLEWSFGIFFFFAPRARASAGADASAARVISF